MFRMMRVHTGLRPRPDRLASIYGSAVWSTMPSSDWYRFLPQPTHRACSDSDQNFAILEEQKRKLVKKSQMSDDTHLISPGFLAKDLVEEVDLRKMRKEEAAHWKEKKMERVKAL